MTSNIHVNQITPKVGEGIFLAKDVEEILRLAY